MPTQLIERAAAEPIELQSGKRKRRTGKELVVFRKMLAAERKSGRPAAEIAAKHGVSLAYIYQLQV